MATTTTVQEVPSYITESLQNNERKMEFPRARSASFNSVGDQTQVQSRQRSNSLSYVSAPRAVSKRRLSSLSFSNWTLGDIVRRLVLASALYFVYLFWINENTSRGDHFRHRPLWLAPLDWIPDFDLQESWFLMGDEDRTSREGLKYAVESLNKDAHLNRLGKLMAAALIKEQLEQRSCVAREVAHKAQKSNLTNVTRKSDPPIVVLGLPRTGTTFMHGMMGVHTSFRVPRFHEYMRSCDTSIFSDRIQGLKMYWLRKLLPALKSIHFIGSDSPEEDIIALGHNMVSMMLFTTFYIPKYMDWIRKDGTERKLKDSLGYLKGFLDIHLRSDDKPWILKTPWHLAQVDEFLQTFPDAKFVWLHRDPIETLSSMVDLVIALVGVGSDLPSTEENRKMLAHYTIDIWFWALERGVEARNRLEGKTKFLDVSFDGLNADPVAVATRAFQEFGYAVDEVNTLRLKEFALENARGKRGHHTHKLEFGVDNEAVRARYNEIVSRIKVTHYIDVSQGSHKPIMEDPARVNHAPNASSQSQQQPKKRKASKSQVDATTTTTPKA